MFASDTSPSSTFSVIRNNDLSTKNLTSEFIKINNWVFQWKLNFNPAPKSKLFFLIKFKNHPNLHQFSIITKWPNQKLKSKVNKTIGLLCQLHHILSRPSLLTICTFFVRPHFDYGNIIYDQTYIVLLHQ